MRRLVGGLVVAIVATLMLGLPGPAGAGASPLLDIDDVTQSEGDAGTTVFTFTVSLNFNNQGGVTFDIATADGPAAAPDDYVAQALTNVFLPFPLTTYEFDVVVNGDTDVELDEDFFVNVTNFVGGSIGDGQGEGTIVNDDPAYPPVIGRFAADPIEGQGTAALQSAADAGVEAERAAALEAQRTSSSSSLSSPVLLAMVAAMALFPVVLVGVMRRRMLRRL